MSGSNDRWRKMAETQMYGWYKQWTRCVVLLEIYSTII
jgi:hypothetical protein